MNPQIPSYAVAMGVASPFEGPKETATNDARTEAELAAYRAMPRAQRREFDRAAARALKKYRRRGVDVRP